MKISDISTNLFTQVTIMDFGVRFIYFDEKAWRKSGLTVHHKQFFQAIINVLSDGRISILSRNMAMLSKEQVDEIERVREIIMIELKELKNNGKD